MKAPAKEKKKNEIHSWKLQHIMMNFEDFLHILKWHIEWQVSLEISNAVKFSIPKHFIENNFFVISVTFVFRSK